MHDSLCCCCEVFFFYYHLHSSLSWCDARLNVDVGGRSNLHRRATFFIILNFSVVFFLKNLFCVCVVGYLGGSSNENSPPSTPGINRNASFNVCNNPEGNGRVMNDKSHLSKSEILTKDILCNLNQFQRKQKKGTIDVWWLYDDGG